MGRGLCFSDILGLYVQGGYAWRATRKCRFRDKRCRGLVRWNIWGPGVLLGCLFLSVDLCVGCSQERAETDRAAWTPLGVGLCFRGGAG